RLYSERQKGGAVGIAHFIFTHKAGLIGPALSFVGKNRPGDDHSQPGPNVTIMIDNNMSN
ncbi:MAG: hypothetical protein K2N16_09540, partial [Muribaculaceae bacterium]|nr:hypothetical protein [Muribaculaceae bacterium]